MPLHAIAKDLWTLSGRLRMLGVDLQRHGQVVREPGTGELCLLSPVPMGDAEADALRGIGAVACLVAPSHLHDTAVKEAADRYPEARVFAAEGLEGRLPRAVPLTPDTWRDAEGWSGVLEAWPLAGMPRVRETVFFHRPTGSLLVADAVFNLRTAPGPFTRLAFWVAGAWRRPGPDHVFALMVRDRQAFRASVAPVLELPIKRIVPCHGDVLETSDDVAQALKRLGRI